MLSVSGQCGCSSTVSLVCISSMCLVQHFLVSTLFFRLWIILLRPSLSSLIFLLINQSDRCWVPLVWLEGAGLPVMAVYRVTLSTKVEAPRHPRHPPPLSNAFLNRKYE